MATIIGTSGADTLFSAAGASDTILGLEGDDTITVAEIDDGDSINGGAGIDTLFILAQKTDPNSNILRYISLNIDRIERLIPSNADITLRLRDSSPRPVGTDDGRPLLIDARDVDRTHSFAFDASGVTSISITLFGGDGDDLVIGTNNDDFLVGNGARVRNYLSGRGGNDTYVISNATDIVDEQPGEGSINFGGFDTVYASVSYALQPVPLDLNERAFRSPEIEVLSTQNQRGFEPINLTGNFYAQKIIGNFGANILNGNGGADTLIGLAGDDVYVVGDAAAVIVENPGEGYDLVYANVSYALTGLAAVEELGFATQGATDNLNLVGNAFDQKIVGNYGNNVLNGNGGVDTLIGLLGNDTYVVGDSRTVVIENGGEGFDTVFANTSYTLAAGSSIEVLSIATQGGTESYDLTGNGFAQAVIGNNGVNVIDGGAGADTLTGLGGADTFRFSTALGNGNVDAITDFGNGADRISLASGIFTGMAQGTLSASNFVNGTAATTADQHIIYNQATGQLFFDADGSGAGAAVLFATVAANTLITASMITVA